MDKWLKKYATIPIQIKASFWFLICSFLQKGIMVITTPIFTRLMSTQEYGQFGVFNSWMGIVSVFVTLNLYSGMYTRGLVKYADRKTVLSSSLQSLVLLMATCWTAVYLIFHNYINSLTSLTTFQTLCMLLMIWTSGAFNFWAAEQRVELHYKSLVYLTLTVSIIKPVVTILLVSHAQDKVTARIMGLAMVELVFFTGCYLNQLKRGKRFYDRQFWHEAFLFNIPLVPHYLSMTILNGADKIMIERMVGSSEAGIYNLAYQIAQVMMLFNVALTQTIEPWLYQKINAKRTEDIRSVAYPSWIFVALINLLLILMAPEIVLFFAPRAYYHAIWVIPPIAMSVYFIFLYAYFAVFEFYYTKTKLAAVATCTGAVLNVVLNYIFIRRFGYFAAGYTTLFCYIVYTVMHYVFMKVVTRQNSTESNTYSLKFMLVLSAGFILVGFAIMFTYNYPVIRYSLLGIALIAAVVKRNDIIGFVRRMLSVRKEKGRAE